MVFAHLLFLGIEPDALADQMTTAFAPDIKWHFKPDNQDSFMKLAGTVPQGPMRAMELRGKRQVATGDRRERKQTTTTKKRGVNFHRAYLVPALFARVPVRRVVKVIRTGSR